MKEIFDAASLARTAKQNGERYYEFLRVPDLSMGLYQLKAGMEDPQKPHGQDEVYYVMKGKAGFLREGELTQVSAGSIMYVAAGERHKFVEIEDDLEVLVFFAPAEDD